MENFDSPSFLNRELAWLYFNDRVLQQAEDSKIPLLERLRFLGIFHSNLDEFFMKRISIPRAEAMYHKDKDKTNLYQDIHSMVQKLFDRASTCFTKDLVPELKKERVEFLKWSDLNQTEREGFTRYFETHILPALTPLAVDPGHPFPHISSLTTSMAFKLYHPSTNTHTFARVKVPTMLPDFFPVPRKNGQHWIHVNEIIRELISALFPMSKIESTLFFRVTRNIEFEREEEEATDILEMISEELKERRFGHTVKLECEPHPDPWILNVLKSELEVNDLDIYYMQSPLINFQELDHIYEEGKANLKFPPWTPLIPQQFKNQPSFSGGLFKLIDEGDILLHHPYENYTHTVERFIIEAAQDPDVIGIKLSLYRTNKDSRLVKALINATENGKEVVCVIELKARFDEANNISWANKLEDAGAHIIYGMVGLKTHCKIALVTRKVPQGLKCYAHIGSGNYNAVTSAFYTDIGLMTSRPAITDDVVQVFNYLTGKTEPQKFNKLLVAPFNLRTQILALIQNEIANHKKGLPAGITVKLNNLEDKKISEALYFAASQGVKINLAVRSICVLKPEDERVKKNIRIISVVDQFLEHSRIYHFRNGQKHDIEGLYYIGSADWMTRNFDRRVEVLTPIEPLELKKICHQVLELTFADNTQSWEMKPNGQYSRIRRDKKRAVNFQLELKRLYSELYGNQGDA
ncbi:MAG: polyphosphate kinase 1 [Bdellovibrionaceae bacterium]|nr:polyphosphate kinase 1 [Pseudobdellovibrionaceae bacterium]